MLFALCALLLVSFVGGQFTGPVITSLPLPSTTSFSLTLPTQASSSNGSAAGKAACKCLASVLPGKYSSALVSLPKYLQSREYWNSRNDLATPACAIYPTTSDDVALALKVIKSSNSRFAVRSKGGHQPNARFSSVDNGVLIDLSSMSNISYDATAQMVIYGPGNHYGDIYKYTEKYGVTVVGARLSGVGTGLGLGGGLSYLSGTYGMSCDAFRSLTVVLPNGTITEITAQSNPDLFTAMKGGGGNQLGIVTQYTVAARKIGKVWAGNLVMALNYSQQVLQVAADFARYNTDDKAATITTFEEVLIPDLAINLSEFCLVFLVYNGEDPGDVFKNFTDIPHLVNTGMLRSYTDATNMVPLSTEISKGQNFFRVSAFALDTDTALQDAYTSWKNWATLNKQSYLLTSLDVEPVPQSLLDASAAQGSNAMDMKSLKGPFVWVNWLITTSPLLSQGEYDRVQTSFKAAAEKVPSTKGLPLFQNDAAADQNPISTYKNYPLLQRVKSTIDPDNFFTNFTGGWSFSAPSNYE